MLESNIITEKAEKAICSILQRENDVLIRYRKNKHEIEIVEQRLSVRDKIKITTE